MTLLKFIKSGMMLLSSLLFFNKRSKILYLHDVHDTHVYAESDGSVSIYDFKNIINQIYKSKFEIVSQISEQKYQVMICFDDGYRGIWDCKDFFLDNSIFPTVFLATSLIGKKNYLNAEEILYLSQKGFRFQSHTADHVPLPGLNKQELCCQLQYSKQELQSLLTKQVTEFCFPLGFFDSPSVTKASAEYNILYSSVPGDYFHPLNNGMICRNLIQGFTPFMVKLTLFGGLQIFKFRIFKQHKKD